jgi:hypothetical protein
MLLAAEDIDSSEEDQIQRMAQHMPTAGLTGAGAHFLYASKALRGTYGDRTIRVWYLDRRMPPADSSMNEKFVSLIQQGRPVMVATPQHGMVAIAVRYAVRPDGIYDISGIKVNDPNKQAVQAAGSRWVEGQELRDIFGFMAIEGKTQTTGGKSGTKKVEDNLAGTWRGRINQSGITAVFRIKKDEDGYSAKTDSPDQGVSNISTEITVNGQDVEIEIATRPFKSSFSGRLDEKTIEGTWSQGGNEWPLKLRKQ